MRKYDADFNLISEFGQMNLTGYWAGMARYTDIAVAGDGKVYLVDSGYHSVHVYAPDVPAAASPTGLIQNGDFIQTLTPTLTASPQSSKLALLTPQALPPDFTGLSSWTVGGLLGVSRSTETSTSDRYAMRLAGPVTQADQGLTDAWAYQTFAIPAGTIDNLLSFNYRVFANDSIQNSDFSALLYDGNGLEKLEVLVHAGLPMTSTLPGEATDLGWQTVSLNLDAYRGQTVRVLFQVRNLNPTAKGAWAFVEQVEIQNQRALYLPLITH